MKAVAGKSGCLVVVAAIGGIAWALMRKYGTESVTNLFMIYSFINRKHHSGVFKG